MAGTCGFSVTPPVRRRPARLGALLLAALAVAGCESLPEAGGESVYRDVDERRRDRTFGTGRGSVFDVFGVSEVAGVEVGGGRSEALTGTEVNRHLWRASLDTLGFLPIASTDPFSGLIATDWGAPEGAADERFRVTTYVTSRTLSPESLRVAVFRQTATPGGWTPAPVGDDVARQIEDAILVRARQLRLAERETG